MEDFIFYKVFFFALEFLQKKFLSHRDVWNKGSLFFRGVNFTKKYFLLKVVLKNLMQKITENF